MQITIQGHGLKITNPLRDYAEKKIGKFEEFFKNIQKASLVLDYRQIANNDRSNVAEVSVWLAGLKVIRATAAGKDMYAAIDLVAEEVERQIKKHKEKHVKEARREAEKMKKEMRAYKPSLSPADKPPIVRVNRSADKPMNEEEARAELKMLGYDFLLFRDADSDEPRLAYKISRAYKILNPNKSKVASMYVEIAAKKLKEIKRNFLPFVNAKTRELNILYKRTAGSLGLVEPEI